MSNTPEMERRKKLYDSELFKVLEGAFRMQGVSKPGTEEFYESLFELDSLIQAEKEKALRSLVEDAIEHRSITVAVGEQYDNPYISIERLKECLARALGGKE